MIVKVPIYFLVETDSDAKSISDVSLYLDHLQSLLEEHLRDSSFKLEGSWWNADRIKARFVTTEEALEALRTGPKTKKEKSK